MSFVGIADGSAVVWLSNVNVTVLVCSCSVLVVNVCANLPPPTPPAEASLDITSLLLPSPHAQVYCTVAPLVFVVVFSK